MHHSSEVDPEIAERLNEGVKEMFGLGPTGEFPEGKLTDQDEGEIKFAVGYTDGKVVIDFGGPVAWVGMSRDQAKELARSILKYADPVTRPSDGD